MQRLARLIVTSVLVVCVGGCSTVGYYAQAVRGHLTVMHSARPIGELVADPAVAPAEREKLSSVLAIRRFASDRLALPDNDSYTSYADIGRPFVVWNVFVAPELSLAPRQWCFLIVGCVVYRGYFDAAAAESFAARYVAAGDDVYVGGSPAYSTLGWFDDPVLSTVLSLPEEELAGLIFHELAHQVAFAKGDTTFNESFATTVEMEGVERWLQSSGGAARIASYRERKRRDREVIALILRYRSRLETVYASAHPDALKRARKRELIEELGQAYRELAGRWAGYTGYRHWFDGTINNARLVSVAAYYDWVPAFQRLLDQHDGDLRRFYTAVRELAKASATARAQALGALLPGPPAGGSAR